jgi:hypothetical protein
MNQTKKRLHIIKLAISITDIETIQLQILKLTPMKSDASIQEIISLLQEGSYVKAQSIITTYMEITPDTIIQRSSHTENMAYQIKEDNLIDEFQLMITPTVHTSSSIAKEMNKEDFKTLLHPDEKEDGFFAKSDVSAKDMPSEKEIKKEEEENDTFFQEIEEEKVEEIKQEEENIAEVKEIKKERVEEEKEKRVVIETFHTEKSLEEKSLEEKIIENKKEEIKKEEVKKELVEESHHYQAIPHITQKLIYMEKRYPPHKSSDEKFESVDTLLETISTLGYKDEDIDTVLDTIQKLVAIEEMEEASELLYICASTESQFAQFMLARELYKGVLLKKNIEASFSLMDTLAKDDYPEALCDLGQFYENGIATITDLDKAQHLYKQAMEKGIKRAMKHHAKLQKQSKGFF